MVPIREVYARLFKFLVDVIQPIHNVCWNSVHWNPGEGNLLISTGFYKFEDPDYMKQVERIPNN